MTTPLAASRDAGWRQIVAAFAIIIPSAICMQLVATNARAGMALGSLILLGAIVAVALIGVGVMLGGILTLLGWPGQWVARLAPLLLGAAAVFLIFAR